MGQVKGKEDLPLHSSRGARGRAIYRLFAASNLAGILAILCYRVTNIPEGLGLMLVWAAMTLSELWFSLYWLLTQTVRWDPIYRSTFKDRLSHKFEEELPGVDAFVCTADPSKEPPLLVISTVLSLMAYDYPPEKLSVYLSDDGGSDLTLYALLEASAFSKDWLPFCRKFEIEPRSPAAFFSMKPQPLSSKDEWLVVKNLYEEMANRVETAVSLGRVPSEIREEQESLFSEWNSNTNSRDHPAILKILIGGGDSKAVDVDGHPLPTLVYLAREKRLGYSHHFKAGAMNALLRVSSEISNAPIILNADCDMYSNDSQSVRDALCFFMDEKTGRQIAFVQFPQCFNNITKNDIYDASLRTISEVDFYGLDRFGGPLYVGSGCFHRRESLTGRKYSEDFKGELNGRTWNKSAEMVRELEEKGKNLATCAYEEGTLWGSEVGLKYGCPVEDVITGLSIQCRGWKSVYLSPKRAAFLGLATTTLNDTLIQQKRWSEGDFQIFISKYCPFLYGHRKITLGLQMCYATYCLWVANSLPTLCYAIAPSLCLLTNVSIFPKISSLWSIAFLYVSISTYGYSLVEMLYLGGTFKMWWNAQRMWMIRRATSYFFAFLDSILKLVGMGETKFALTSKVADTEASTRYKNEIMEFGTTSTMFILLTTLAVHNLVCWISIVFKVVLKGLGVLDALLLQAALCGFIVLISLPIYEAAFLRRDKGRIPTSVTLISVILALIVSFLAVR